MNIIGAGLPRTGTSTLQDTLNLLGFGPCFHAREIVGNDAEIDRWIAGFRGPPVDLRAALHGYRATTDSPACFYWRELADEYPDAKVILGVRDPHSWYRSMTKTVLRPGMFDETGDPECDPALRGLRRLADAMNDKVFGHRHDEDSLLDAYHRHNDEVRKGIPAERLLEYDVAQGWGPLCEFLGVAVPDTPFPWLNDSRQFVANVENHRNG
jgi:hypothetical protein